MSNFYYLSNDLDTLENKMQNFVSVLETIASSDSDDLSSGTMWFIHDTVKQYAYTRVRNQERQEKECWLKSKVSLLNTSDVIGVDQAMATVCMTMDTLIAMSV